MDKFTLGVVIPVHGREQVTRVVLDYYKRIRLLLGIETVFLIVTSPDDPCKDMWRDYANGGFWICSTPNKPLSDKFNTGIRTLETNFDLDAVTVIGSDDLATCQYLEEAAQRVREGYDFVSASGIAFYSKEDWRLFFTRSLNVGACSLISTRVLRNFRGEPFHPGRNHGVDTQFVRRCYQYGITKTSQINVSLESEFMIVDIKTRGENINNYDALNSIFAPKSVKVDPTFFFDRYFPGVLTQL